MAVYASGRHGAAHEAVRDAVDRHEPDAVFFLFPYSGMEKDMLACVERSRNIVLAGPAPCAPHRFEEIVEKAAHHRARLYALSANLYAPGFQRIFREIRTEDFGRTVYYRHLSGVARGLLNGWWNMIRMMEMREEGTGRSPVSVFLSAQKQGSVWLMVAMIRTADGGNAHLVYAPHLPGSADDLLILGSGGMILYEGARNHPAIYRTDGTIRLSESERLTTLLERSDEYMRLLEPADAIKRHDQAIRILSAIRQSAETGVGVCVAYPPL
jgi:predicted dehydrogenase